MEKVIKSSIDAEEAYDKKSTSTEDKNTQENRNWESLTRTNIYINIDFILLIYK